MGPILIWLLLTAGLVAIFARRLLRKSDEEWLSEETARFLEKLRQTLAANHSGVCALGVSEDGGLLVLKAEHQEVLVPFGELYSLERAFPEAFAETIDHVVQEVLERLTSLEDVPFDEAIADILPQVRSQTWIRGNSPALGPGRVLTRPLHEDLVVCYVIDEARSMVFITEGHLEAWRCTSTDIDNLAMSNLLAFAKEKGGVPFPTASDEEPRVLHTGDGYDAARLLLVLETVRNTDVEDLLFAIPDRDSLVVSRLPSDLDRLADEVRQEYAKSPHPISPLLYRIQGSKLVTFAGKQQPA